MNTFEQYKKFVCSLEQTPVIRKWVTTQLAEFLLDETLINDIKVALTEALTNIFRHGAHQALTEPVEIGIRIDNENIRISLRDYGNHFDLSNYKAPDLDAASEGGYGIYLIHKLMDNVQYIPHESGTELLMWKSRKPK